MPARDASAGADFRGRLRKRAILERSRAVACAEIAASLREQAAIADEPLRALHGRIAALQERVAERHRISADIHDLLAARPAQTGGAGRRLADGGSVRPAFMASVAEIVGVSSAFATLGTPCRAAAVVATSDATAQAAHDLELVMAEGPVTDAAHGTAVSATGTLLLERWPSYGPAVAELGVHAVSAAPLGPRGARVGALCALDQAPAANERVLTATGLMADVLTRLVLDVPKDSVLIHDAGALPFTEWSGQEVIHQAAGIVSVHCGCRVDEAADLLAARAFADGSPVRAIAQQVVSGQLRLC